jgi:hypothetical protein
MPLARLRPARAARRLALAASIVGPAAPLAAQPPASPAPAAPSPATPPAPHPLPVGSLGGTVVDSLLGAGPLADVEVWIDGTTLTTRTDRAGRFRFDSVPAGRHRVAFVHPGLETQRIGTPTATVEIQPGGHAEAALVTPSPAAVHGALCPADAEPHTGLLLGLVAPPDAPGAAADVVVSWVVLSIGRGGVQSVPRELTLRTGDDGAFRVCGVPTDIPVQLRAQGSDGAIAVIEAAFDRRRVALARVPLPAAVAPAPASDVAGDSTLRARSATVRGSVRSPHGLPIAGAAVEVVGTPSPATAITREDGSFVLVGAPAGAQLLEARAIGFRPVRTRLTLVAGRVTPVVLALGDDATVLASTRVTARRRSEMVEGYERRLAAGAGRFVTRADIERRRALSTTELVALVPGVRIAPPSQAFDAPQIAFARTLTGPLTNGDCKPLLYVDGVRAMMPLDALVRPQELYGIEVHASTATIPPQFAGPDAGCGVVLLWTRRSRER